MYINARLEAKTDVTQTIPELLDAYKEDLEADYGARKTLSWLIFVLVVWLLGVAATIVFVGIGTITLQSSVLVALITGATVSLIGLLGTVVSYFFTKSAEQQAIFKGLFEIMLEKEDEDSTPPAGVLEGD